MPEGNPLNTTLPVDTAHVGCVIVPTVGAAGVAGWALITTFAEADEVHPVAVSVTVKLYILATSPGIVVVVPVPEIAPGCIVHAPDGNPLKATLPVDKIQVG